MAKIMSSEEEKELIKSIVPEALDLFRYDITQIEYMNIDKKVFDEIILRLLTESNLDVDSRYNEIYKIWESYGSENTGDKRTSLYKGFKIIDENGKVVGTTPPLLDAEDFGINRSKFDMIIQSQANNSLSRVKANDLVYSKNKVNHWNDFYIAYLGYNPHKSEVESNMENNSTDNGCEEVVL